MAVTVGYAALQARVRARRSRLLEEVDWRRLLEADDPRRELDAATMGEAVERHAELTTIERRLRRRVYDETWSLAEHAPRAARDLLRWYAGRFTVQDIKLLIRVLHHGRPAREALDAMTLYDENVSADSFVHARSLADLLRALGRTPYGRALDNAWERYQAERRPFYLEVALDLAFERGLVERIDALSGGDAADARALLGTWLARKNLIAAVRYRALAGVRPEEIVNFCLHRDFGGGLAMVQRVAAGAPLRQEAAALGLELSAEGSERDLLLEAERATDEQRRRAAEQRFARSPFGLGLVLAYLIQLEAQSDDLVRILEGKAQGIDGDALRARLPKGAHRRVDP